MMVQAAYIEAIVFSGLSIMLPTAPRGHEAQLQLICFAFEPEVHFNCDWALSPH